MMSRSMPFSLLTCSMTRFRSGSMAPSSPHGSALGRLTTQGETLDEARDMAKDATATSQRSVRTARSSRTAPGSDREPCGELLAHAPACRHWLKEAAERGEPLAVEKL